MSDQSPAPQQQHRVILNPFQRMAGNRSIIIGPDGTPLSPATQARVRLAADFLNMLAGGVVITGALGVVIAFATTARIDPNRAFIIVAIVFFCVLGGIVLHYMASTILSALDE